MIKSLITKIEEKYVFNISTFVWHVLVGLAGLGLIAGLGLLIWGVIPAFKSSVQKDSYPPLAVVSAEEVEISLNPQTAKKGQQTERPAPATQTKQQTEQPISSSFDAEGEKLYNAVLDSLRTLLPEAKFAWHSQGYWEYPYGENTYNYSRDERYRRWIVREYGIYDLLNTVFDRTGTQTSRDKATLVSAYLSIIRQFPDEERRRALDAVMWVSKESQSKSLANTQLLQRSLQHFLSKRLAALTQCADFIANNPNDGAPFVEYVVSVVDTFKETTRPEILTTLQRSYYQYFNNKLERQKELTNAFIQMTSRFEEKKQPTALEAYYRLSMNRNAQRERDIRAIDYKYEAELAKVEAEHQLAKAKKVEQRLLGLYGVGSALGAIAVIGILLVLFSIQRYVKLIGNKLMSGGSNIPVS